VATVLGTLLAFALVRHDFRGKGAGNILVFIPMATPEIVLGASLLTIFVQGFNQVGLTLGFWTIVIAHIMFCLSFVVVTVKADCKASIHAWKRPPRTCMPARQHLLAGHLPARAARHRLGCAVVLLAVLRRLHHHQLRLR
jgi:ABC-type sugar transport system permease subunit